MAKAQTLSNMLIDHRAFEKARQSRDPRFDGRFFVGVKTTGIYCRPVCPVRLPKAANITFFPTAAAASVAGYRPCLRCRPEVSPGTPAWRGTSTTVSRALRMIAEGALDEQSVKQLCERLGVSERHLSRLFSKHLGASPGTVAKTRRLQFAKKLIDETKLPMTEIAMSSGYGSVRRFNDHFKKTYGRNPSSLRNKPVVDSDGSLTLTLPFRKPFDFKGLIGFFAARAIPGVEQVATDRYARSIQLEGKPAYLTLTEKADHISCQLLLGSPASLVGVAEKVKRLFDLDAIPSEIEKVLCWDRELGRLVRKYSGMRLPGAWDPFETSIRAIVGQQISVKGATTIMGRLAGEYGDRTSYGLQFPQPAQLSNIDVEELPMPRARATAIREFARAVNEGRVDFDADPASLRQQLLDLPGIGPWTAEYILMRALNNPDTFIGTDLVIKKIAKMYLNIDGEKALLERADAWRPWRAYACMYLWRHSMEV